MEHPSLYLLRRSLPTLNGLIRVLNMLSSQLWVYALSSSVYTVLIAEIGCFHYHRQGLCSL